MTLDTCKALFHQKRCTVLGIGVSNLPLIRFLLNMGAVVTARDKKSFEALGTSAKELKALGVNLLLGEDYLQNLEGDYLFRSPGIRPDLPEIKKAVQCGTVLLSEMELFFELCPCPIIGITGSDGKTTTTTLVSLLLEKSGYRVFLGGNIGTPLLPRVTEMAPSDIAVVELSSFQLFTMKKSPKISVITNLSPNHLDWHRGMEEYLLAKENIYKGDGNQILVLNADNDVTSALYEKLSLEKKRELRRFSSRSLLSGQGDVYEKEGWIYLGDSRILRTCDILLPGKHNRENYMAAIAATAGLATEKAIQTVARTFPGVEHRMEFVRERGGVRFYNSSIDSSPTRTAAGLSSFSEKTLVICGGYDKNIPFEPLAEALCRHAKTVILTGATRESIRLAIEKADADEKPQILCHPLFDDAVLAAVENATFGDTVILSPGCASFDAFPNFMARGNRFKELILALPEPETTSL